MSAPTEEDGMSKFAVDEGTDQEALEKKASDGCPRCGKTPTRHGKTLICESCGTEPWEG